VLRALAAPGGVDTPLPPGSAYSNWDAERLFSCVCDRGYTGPDCSVAVCPHGDSPYTMAQQRRAVVLRVDATGAGSVPAVPPRVRFFFNGGVSDPIELAALASGAPCVAALLRGGRVGLDGEGSSCRVARAGEPSSVDGSPVPSLWTEVVVAMAFPSTTRPFFTNLFSHDGAPPLGAVGCVADPGLPAAVAAGVLCSAAWLDVDALEAAPAPGALLPATLPLGVRYELAVADADSFPARVRVRRVTYGGGPAVATDMGVAPVTTAASQIGLLSDGVFVRWSAAWGHTHGALWVVGSAAGLLGTPQPSLAAPGYREYLSCAGAGVCDADAGVCRCAPGHSGVSCEAVGVVASSVSAPIQRVVALAADYQGTVLSVESQRPLGSADFNYLSVGDSTGEGPFFTLRGDGLLLGRGLAFSNGGVVDGGLTAAVSAPLAPANSAAALSVSYGSTTVPPPAGVVAVASDFPLTDPAAAGSTLLAVRARSEAASAALTDVFTLRGDGLARLGQGLVVDGPAGVSLGGSGGLAVGTGGVAVADGGLSVAGGGTYFRGPQVPGGPPSHRFLGDVEINGTITITNGTLTLATRSPGGLIINDALRVLFETQLDGYTTMLTGAHVTRGGLSVNMGGLWVGTGGLRVDTGGLSMYQGDAVLSGGALSAMGGGLLALDDRVAQTARVALAQPGGPAGSTSVTVASFFSGFAGYSGDLMYLEAESPEDSGQSYNLLRATTRPQAGGAPGARGAETLRIDKFGDLFSSSDLLIGTEAAATSAAAHVSILGGDSNWPGAAGGNVNAVGGDAPQGNGGDARVEGGVGALAGGHAFLTGGYGGTAGGNVHLQAGNSGAPGGEGAVIIKDSLGVPRVTVTGAGDILMTPPSGTITSFASQAPIVTSATLLSLTGSIAVLPIGMNGVGGNAGGEVSVVGGSAAASGQGGSVNILPGSSAGGGTNGIVAIHSATAMGTTRRWAVEDVATTVWSDAVGQPPALTIKHGGGPESSFLSLMGSAYTGGASSVMGDIHVGGNARFIGVGLMEGGLAAMGAAGISVGAGGISVDGGAASVGGALTAHSLMGLVGGLYVEAGGMSLASGDTYLANALSVMGTRVHASGDVLAGGSVSAGAGLTVEGVAAVNGMVSVNGDGYFTGQVTSLDTREMKLVGGLSVGGGLSVAGHTWMPSPLELGSSLLLNTGAQVLGSSTSFYLADASLVSVGGSLEVNGGARIQGDAALQSRLTVDGITALGATAYVSGTLYAGSDVQVAGGVAVVGALAVSGTSTLTQALTMMGGAVLSGGELSMADANHGVTGSPLLLSGASQTLAGVDAAGISLFGGNAEDGGGGSVVLRAGQKGGDLPVQPGAVQLVSAEGDVLVSAGSDGLLLKGGLGGLVSVSPMLAVAGGLSLTSGDATFTRGATVNGALSVGGGASIGGEAAADTLVQVSATGMLSFLGTIGGSGKLDNSMIQRCSSADWQLGGSCYGLFSEDPGAPNTYALLVWNFDTVPHSVLFGAANPQWMEVPPVTMFPIWVQHAARRRSLADANFLPHIERRL
jgi:hypothetical protein